MSEKNHPTPTIPPKEYWEDDRWASKHYNDIVKQYPNQWVAIVDKHVIAAGESFGEVKKEADRQTARERFPIFFVESGIRVY